MISSPLVTAQEVLERGSAFVDEARSSVSSLAGLTPGDRAGILAAHEAERHRLRPVGEDFQGRNPGQGWSMRFDRRGFLVRPDAGGWTWGLELERYGFEGGELEVGEPLGASVEGGRVVYARDGVLDEWYVNDRRGLEHGYTVKRRPRRGTAGEAGPLVLSLAVRGELRPRVTADGRGVVFLDDSGSTALTYEGLSVVDAEGRELGASFVQAGGGLRLRIDERAATYPLTIDPIAQEAYLKASNAEGGDFFGISIDISGDTVVVGANLEDSNASGANGDETNNSASFSGAVYVFVHDGVAWSQQAYLKASNPDLGDQFGASLAISGDTIVVGARNEGSSATGVNGQFQVDNSLPGAGAAYVFVRNGTTWSQQAYLKASNTEVSDLFGGSVDVSGDTIVVVAAGEDSSATGIDGNQADNSASQSGAAYIFVRSGTTWTQEAYVKASNAGADDLFGRASLEGDTLIVGAIGESSQATGVDGDQLDNSAIDAGAAYVFVRSGTTWSQQAYLKASNAESIDLFGLSVAISGDTAVVGAWNESSQATGVDGDQQNNSALSSGAAYIFVRNGTTWTQEAYLKASNSGSLDLFGGAVAVLDDYVAVAADSEAGSAAGVDADQSSNGAWKAGAVYLFVRVGSTWTQQHYLKASNPSFGDGFGRSVALSDELVMVGAFGEESNASGVNGDQQDDSAPAAGAAYALRRTPVAAVYCSGDGSGTACPCGNNASAGKGCSNTTGTGAALRASGTCSVSLDDLLLGASGLVPGRAGLYFQGSNAVNSGLGNMLGDGLLCAGGGLVRLQVVVADAAGNSGTTLDIAAAGAVLAGQTRRYQLWYRDPLASPCGSGFNLSNGLEVNWQP